ncbi:hypothetical protein T484DRAFT_1801363 [Baffinella frigidus]|nr:hypothetical protein T484DRAFT_1801363 [Cryptophyta sp. CCMP2293]
MTSHDRHLLPLLAALVLLVPPALAFSPSPLLHSTRFPASTHAYLHRSPYRTSPSPLGVSDTPSRRFPSVKASDGERSDRGEEEDTPGRGGLPRRAVLLGLPAAAAAWLSGLVAASAAPVEDAALSYNRWGLDQEDL